jgi:methyl-accepting chemotaxis protein
MSWQSAASTRTTEEEILRTLRSINQSASETDKISAATAEVLNAQGEQIDNIARNANKIEENLNTSERLIRGLKSWGGRIANTFTSGPEKNSEPLSSSKYPSYLPKEALEPSGQSMQKDSPEDSVAISANSKRSEFDLEVDKQLDHISNVLGGIHARSLEISDSIARQVKTVESVDRSIDRSNDRMRKQHDDIRKLR